MHSSSTTPSYASVSDTKQSKALNMSKQVMERARSTLEFTSEKVNQSTCGVTLAGSTRSPAPLNGGAAARM